MMNFVRRTPLLHLTLMVSLKVLTTLAAMVILFASALAFAQNPVGPGAPTSGTSLDDPTVYLKIIFDAVENKNWGVLAAGVLVLVVAIFRAFGKKLHDFIPDDSVFDKPLFFLYDTKPGGWILNTVTAAAGGFGTALLAHQTIDFALVRTILSVSLSAAGIWGVIKDSIEYYGKKPTPPSTDKAAAAGAAAAADPSKTLNG